MQTLVLKQPLESGVINKPYPAGLELEFSRVGGAIVVHHPDNNQVTKVVTAENIRTVAIRTISTQTILKSISKFGVLAIDKKVKRSIKKAA